jgi:type IV pilus assembly protein PilC
LEFVCHVGTPEGRVRRETRSAPDERALRAELDREGLSLLVIEKARAKGWRPTWLSLAPRRVPLPTLLVFNQELAALLKAGLPLLQALHLLAERQREPQFKAILEQVRERVKSGVELSEAFAEFGDAFPPLYSSSLKAGERTGELEAVVRRFVRYLKLVLDARKRVYSALVYPALLLGLSVAMIAVMTLFVIPKFSLFYDSMGLKELPTLTRVTMGVSHFLRSNLLLIVAALGAGTLLLQRWSATVRGRLTMDRLRLGLPFLGSVLHRFALSEYCRSLATLLAGGLPLVPALEISTRAVGNAWVRHRLEPAIPRVREGQALHTALGETSIVPELALDMVEVGEATGSLDQMLSNVSEFFDEEVETRMQRILSLIEPIMLILIGGMVAVLLASVYLPVFSALGQVK